MFAADSIPLAIALELVQQEKDAEIALTPNERLFVYMCLQHAEDLGLMKLAETLMHMLALDMATSNTSYKGILKSARQHVEVIDSQSKSLRFRAKN